MPPKLPFDLAIYPKLNNLQAGHLRHFYNLSAQIDGEWRHMGAQEPAQEWDDAYRYQLATMAYASGAAHYHRLPVLRYVFKPLMRQLIHKMLRREVWGYWFNTSMSGKFVDPSLTELRQPWADPVVRENIMYSGHLLLMTSLYAMLFDDDEFEKPDSLVFKWNPIVFVVCNQFPLIAIRYNDIRDNRNVIGPVLERYMAAWKERKMVHANGLYVDWWRPKQDDMVSVADIGLTAWANAYMNAWNSEVVHSAFESQALGFVTTIANKTTLKPSGTANAIRKLFKEEGADPSSPETISRARTIAEASGPIVNTPYPLPVLGYVIQWLSELGKSQELDSLLGFVDTKQNPTWENGGLYYPRQDKLLDPDGNLIRMDPLSGNAAIGYGRLNVQDGQKLMWEKPWTRESFKVRPWIDSPGLESGVDFLRGVWDCDLKALVITMKAWDTRTVDMALAACNLETGRWAVYFDGLLDATYYVTEPHGKIEITVQISGDGELDVVFLKIDTQ
ncbi:hypothetical protein V8C42DRAFT_353921 [Trichoderma barbatum]